MLLDARYAPSTEKLSILAQIIENRQTKDDEKAPLFVSRLLWIDVALSEEVRPQIERQRELIYTSRLEFATLDASANELVTVGEGAPKFTHDSKSPIENVAADATNMSNGNAAEAAAAREEKPLYVRSKASCFF